MKGNCIINIRSLGFTWETQDPFLFCAFHHDKFPAGNELLGPNASLEGRPIGQDFIQKDGWRMYHGNKVPGFPAHPHKGFETVTLVEKGLVDHSDSLGAAGRFGNGDVQWMTAGKGVMHCEMFPLLNQTGENDLLLFQIWLNLPQNKKSVPAHFKMIWKEDIPVYDNTDNNGLKTHIKIINGNFGEIRGPAPAPDSWAADPGNELTILLIQMEPEATFTIPPSSEGINRSLYFYRGDHISFGTEKIPAEKALDLHSQAFSFTNHKEPGYFLFLQGKPINEKVVQHGPFVMNSNAEIEKAVQEFQQNLFGGWPWPSKEHTHSRNKGRFAIYTDGREEIKS